MDIEPDRSEPQFTAPKKFAAVKSDIQHGGFQKTHRNPGLARQTALRVKSDSEPEQIKPQVTASEKLGSCSSRKHSLEIFENCRTLLER